MCQAALSLLDVRFTLTASSAESNNLPTQTRDSHSKSAEWIHLLLLAIAHRNCLVPLLICASPRTVEDTSIGIHLTHEQVRSPPSVLPFFRLSAFLEKEKLSLLCCPSLYLSCVVCVLLLLYLGHLPAGD